MRKNKKRHAELHPEGVHKGTDRGRTNEPDAQARWLAGERASNERETDGVSNIDLAHRLADLQISLATSRDEHSKTLNQMVAAEKKHMRAVELLKEERQQSEAAIRAEAQKRENALSKALDASVAEVRAGKAEVERLDQYCQLLLEEVFEATALADRLSERAACARSERDEAKARLDVQTRLLLLADERIRAIIKEWRRPWERLLKTFGIQRTPKANSELARWDGEMISLFGSATIPELCSAHVQKSPIAAAKSPARRDPYQRAASLDDLIAWDDLDFVRCAYATILGRPPDPEGESHYVEQLRGGCQKLEILWCLRTSSEAGKRGPTVAGLDQALRGIRWRRLARKYFGTSALRL